MRQFGHIDPASMVYYLNDHGFGVAILAGDFVEVRAIFFEVFRDPERATTFDAYSSLLRFARRVTDFRALQYIQ